MGLVATFPHYRKKISIGKYVNKTVNEVSVDFQVSSHQNKR